MDNRRKKLEKMGFVSHDRHKDKVYGPKGSGPREQYEKDLKIELIGDFLKKLRKQENLTQGQLAELMKIDKSYISKIENNLKETKFGTIRRYVEALKVNKMSLKLEFNNGNSEVLELM
ncbi:MAG: helix-turn-helix domain-containing protein [Bacteroidales bacterium]|nr:helix-turn-helix domain-containing protein [Bacteroidales bacterium]